MKRRRLLPVAIVVATVGLTFPISASAQNTTGAGERTTTVNRDSGFDWGWLGLLGLAGLLGMKRKDDHDVRSR
jgi:MYXO-CTERM domain-containing protein